MNLSKAVYDKDYDMVSLMLQYDHDVNYQDEGGNTVLHIACHNGDVEMVILLIGYGANMYTKNNVGRFPIHYVAMKGNIELFQYMAEYNSSCLEVDYDGLSCFDYAAMNGHLEIIKYLIEEANVTPNLLAACKGDYNDVIEYLLSIHVKPDMKCMYYVIRNHNCKMFSKLLPFFSNMNEINSMVSSMGTPDMISIIQLYNSFNNISL